MAVWLIDSDILVDIADAIRVKDGTSAVIQVSDLASRISNLPSSAFTILNPVSVIENTVTLHDEFTILNPVSVIVNNVTIS